MRQHICGQYPSTRLHGITFHSDCNFGNYLINYMEVLSEINGKKKLHLNYHKLLEQLFKSFTAIFLHNHDTLPYKKFTPFKKICTHYRSTSTSQKLQLLTSCYGVSRWSQWPRSLRRRSMAARPLISWVRIPPGAWMSVCCECCVLSGRGLCDELTTRTEESY